MFRHDQHCQQGWITRGGTGRNRPAARCGAARPLWGTRRNDTMDYRPYERPREAHIRVELVERVRREIAEGAYDTPEKLEIALERMLDRLVEE